ncbi:Uncharacterised protein [Serratia fonticola]|uniref:hypothetical protein n=1 Tax=Serratia fonticola TaxID=47917 RepID=UPI002182E3A4|nr:hypothetical protein [Serratia fonticola]CAI2158459.1 Uncharacterised protein [Serratia fonticola]
MSRKPKKKEENCSQSPSAVSHRTKNQLYQRLGFNQKKIFLGHDALEKLAFLVNLQHGKNVKDPMVVSDVLSYCINTCYNSKSVQAEAKKRGGLPKVVKAAKTPEGQRLYRYYQMAQVGDAVDLVEAFNATDKRGKLYFPHTDDVNANIDLGDLYLDQDLEDDEEADDGKDQWSTVEIQALRGRKAISEAIKELNEDASPSSQAGNGSKDPDDWPEK